MTNNKETLNRDISKLGFAAIALNGVIGAGIFALPAVAAARSGNLSPWLFLFCAVLIMTVVLCMSRAASFFDETGGPIQYAGKAFGPFAGFQTGWLYYIGRLSAMAANIKLMVIYAGWFWTPLESGMIHNLAVVFIFAVLTLVNVAGVRNSMMVIYLLSAMKLVPILLLATVGLAYVQPELLINTGIPDFSSFGETVLVLLYAFVGFESATVLAGEARNAQRDIPRALTYTVLVITVIYFAIQLVSISVLPDLANSKTPLADAAVVVLGSTGAILLTLGAVFSIGGNCHSSMLSAPRMTYAMAYMGTMPAWFGKVNQRFRTPVNSIVFYAVVGLALALSGSFIWLAVVSTLARLLCYILSVAALPVLEKTLQPSEHEFRLPGGRLIPGIALLLCVWLSTFASMTQWATTIGFFVMGSVLFFFSRKGNVSKTN